MSKFVYLDAAATTPLAPEVLETMGPVLRGLLGNASSGHWAGRLAAQLLDEARSALAEITGGHHAVIFTSGATESNNLALMGLLSTGLAQRFVGFATEHEAVLSPLRQLASRGHDVHIVPVDNLGRPNLEHLAALVVPGTLVSAMAANNETGTITDIAAVSDAVHARGGLLHTDASQAIGWGLVDGMAQADLITVSAHKMYGPQGVGALLTTSDVRSRIQPLVYGGGQERGLRSGTYNVAGVVGMSAATRLALECGPAFAKQVRPLRDRLWARLRADFPWAVRNGDPTNCLPGTLNVSFATSELSCPADAVLAHMPTIAASSGSACSAGAPGPSHVLSAMGLDDARIDSALRFSLPRGISEATIDAASQTIVDAVRTVCGLSNACSEEEQWKVAQAR